MLTLLAKVGLPRTLVHIWGGAGRMNTCPQAQPTNPQRLCPQAQTLLARRSPPLLLALAIISTPPGAHSPPQGALGLGLWHLKWGCRQHPLGAPKTPSNARPHWWDGRHRQGISV